MHDAYIYINVIAPNLLSIQKYNIGKETLVGKNQLEDGTYQGSLKDVVYLG
jgi:hypothetical protein